MPDADLEELRREIERLARERDQACQRVRQLEDKLRATVARATTDELTGFRNRRAGQEILGTELRRSSRTGAPTALVFADLDGFKQVNDQLGHDRGDALLARISAQVRAVLRRYDSAVRWGGDEFCFVLPATGSEAAALVARKICSAVGALDFDPRSSVTVSCGVATTDEPIMREAVTDVDIGRGTITGLEGQCRASDAVATLTFRLQRLLFKAADRRCYCAKQHQGKNCIVATIASQASVKACASCSLQDDVVRISHYYWRADGSKWIPG